jgi:hypothetical protein
MINNRRLDKYCTNDTDSFSNRYTPISYTLALAFIKQKLDNSWPSFLMVLLPRFVQKTGNQCLKC